MIAAMKRLLADYQRLQAELMADPRYRRLQDMAVTLRMMGEYEPGARAAKASSILRGVAGLLAHDQKAVAADVKPKRMKTTGKKAKFVMPAVLKVLQHDAPLDTDTLLARVQKEGGLSETTDPYPKRTLAVVLAGGARYGRVKKLADGRWNITAKGTKEHLADAAKGS